MNVFKLEDGVLGLSPQQTPTSTILSVPAESTNLSPVSSADLNYENTSDFNLSFFEHPKKEEYEERPPCIYTSDQLDSLPLYSDAKSEYPPPPIYPGTNQQPVSSDSSCSPNSTVTLLYEQKPVINSVTQSYTTSKQNYVKPDQSFTAADSNSAPSSKSFIPCKVCGDKASGYHYGVTSCEGCKGFFRRSIQKQIEYRCLRDGKCLVIRLNRNRCQYCRFKKCLAVGMSRDSVRYGRVPKRSRDKHTDDIKDGIAPITDISAARELETKQLAIYDIILTISQAHHANCAYTEERTRGLIKKVAIFSLNDMNQTEGNADSSSVDSMEQQKIVMWQHFANFVTPAIKGVVEFAKRVPIFSELTQDDQLILIKLGFMEIFFIQVSRMYNPLDNTMTFHDGSYITGQQMELMFDHEYVMSLLNLMTTLNNLQLNDTEIGLLSAIILLMSDRTGIYDQKAIEQQQDKLAEALKMQIARNHPSDGHLFSNIMMKIPELRALGNKHSDHLNWFRSNWMKLTLPPLFAEIFDIPKAEDDDVFQ